MSAFQPTDTADLLAIVSSAIAEKQTLDIEGGGSKRPLGRPTSAQHTLDMRAFDRLIAYEPSELVLTAEAALPMRTIAAELATHDQMLAFEPPDWRGLLGTRGEPTLGGTIACNLAGPRRVRAGAARDHILGFSAVNGWGEAWKAGGRVVKNVTGYDMSKLQAGAYGTLSVLTEISVRVLPRPESSCSLLLSGLTDEAAIVVLATALNGPDEVSAAAHLPAVVAARSGVAVVAGASATTVLRLEGPRPSVDFRATTLQGLLGPMERLDELESLALWSEIAAVAPLLSPTERLIWRICPTPSMAPALLARVRSRLPSTEGFYDWGGGLLWLTLDAAEAGPDGGAALVRSAVAQAGGHATLLRAPEALRASVPVFEPAPRALDALVRRVKASFDPYGILNPGRMQEGL